MQRWAVRFAAPPSSISSYLSPGVRERTRLASYVGPGPVFDAASSATIPTPGYVDLRLRYQISGPAGWVVTVGLDNVLDQVYEPVRGYPAPGRTVFISAAAQF